MPNVRTLWANDPPHLRAAFSVLGLSEIEGAKHEKKVLAMYAASGHPEIHDDETPWCAAYVGWCLKQADQPGTNSLLAISYAKYGIACDRSKPAPRGAIAVWPRTNGNHVNFVLGEVVRDGVVYLVCIGGNQFNKRGGGVTISERVKSEAKAIRLPPYMLALADVPLPRPKPAPMPHIETEPQPAPMPYIETEPQPAPMPHIETEPKPAPQLDRDNEPDAPLPPAGPIERGAVPGLWQRIKNRVLGWGTAAGGLGGLAWITDPLAWAKGLSLLLAAVFCAALILLALAFLIYGRARVANYLQRFLPT